MVRTRLNKAMKRMTRPFRSAFCVSSYGMGVYEAHLRARLRPSIHSRCLGKSDFTSRVGLLVRKGPYKAMKGSIRPLRT